VAIYDRFLQIFQAIHKQIFFETLWKKLFQRANNQLSIKSVTVQYREEMQLRLLQQLWCHDILIFVDLSPSILVLTSFARIGESLHDV
jgi:hypothetical protein